jgi:hypothetical protein
MNEEQKPKRYYKKKKKKPAPIEPIELVKGIFDDEFVVIEPTKEEIVDRKDKLAIIEKIIQSKSFLIIFDEMEIEVDTIGMTPERINKVLELTNQSAKENEKQI